MRFQLVSNLIGGGAGSRPLPVPRSDALILLGNCIHPSTQRQLVVAKAQWTHVVAVPGPRELADMSCAVATCRDLDIEFLNNTVRTLGRTTFMGTPMCPEEMNTYWHDEDVEAVQREIRSNGYAPDPMVILSYWRAGSATLEYVGARPAGPAPWLRWFYASDAPLSGFYGRIWECGAADSDAVYEFSGAAAAAPLAAKEGARTPL